MNNSSRERNDCYVDSSSYPVTFLVPAVAISLLLAFLKRRRSYKTHLWEGRPGIVIPVNILDIDHDRLAIMAVFGALTGVIVGLIRRVKMQNVDGWASALYGIGICLMYAILYYPFFACFATKHKILGATAGLLYGFVWLVVSLLNDFDKCNGLSGMENLLIFLLILPQTLCLVFVLVKYALVLCQEIRRTGGSFSFKQERPTEEKVFVKPWLFSYVKDLLKPRFVMVDTRAMYYLRKIYSPARNFRFSTLTVSIVMTCCIIGYMGTVSLLYLGALLVNKDRESRYSVLFKRGGISLLVSAFISAFFCAISIVRFMEHHKNNMLRMFKGDKSFIPESFVMSQVMVGRSLRYAPFHLSYFVWGDLLIFIISFIICLLLLLGEYVLSSYEIRMMPWQWIQGLIVWLVVALLFWIVLWFASLTIFRDSLFPKNVIALDNRNVFMMFSYVSFFIGLPMGFLSAISRVLKAAVIALLLLPRIDRSVMSEGFQRLDPGFYAYVCYLYVQAAFRNPIFRVFCQILYDTQKSSCTKRSPSSTRLRNKWFLLLTLARNPQLMQLRKFVLAPSVKYISGGELKDPLSEC